MRYFVNSALVRRLVYLYVPFLQLNDVPQFHSNSFQHSNRLGFQSNSSHFLFQLSTIQMNGRQLKQWIMLFILMMSKVINISVHRMSKDNIPLNCCIISFSKRILLPGCRLILRISEILCMPSMSLSSSAWCRATISLSKSIAARFGTTIWKPWHKPLLLAFSYFFFWNSFLWTIFRFAFIESNTFLKMFNGTTVYRH